MKSVVHHPGLVSRLFITGSYINSKSIMCTAACCGYKMKENEVVTCSSACSCSRKPRGNSLFHNLDYLHESTQVVV